MMTRESVQMRQVLGYFWPGEQGAHTPGGFMEALIRAVCKADDQNKDRLYSAFPAVVWAVRCCQEMSKGEAVGLILAEIMREAEGPL